MKTTDEIKGSVGFRIERSSEDGGLGIVQRGKLHASVIWSYGGGWDHVSVAPFRPSYTPSWDDMCWIKDLFFYPDEWAVQFHPAKSKYVNFLPNCLHLWRPQTEAMPTPPQNMV